MTTIILLFIAGFIQETLLISYHKALAKNLAILAALLTTATWIISVFVISEILILIHTSQSLQSTILISSFASGKFSGAYLAIKYFNRNGNYSE